MLNYSIMPLDTAHLDEICNDIKYQYENNISTCVLFSMPVVPEGSPAINKGKILGEKFALFRDKLASMGLKCGILAQATIGHGWKLSEMFPYTQYTGLNDGVKTHTCCPEDDGFCDYIRDTFRTLALYKPEIIMVDDDLRLIFRQGGGCACERHMEMFNKRAGTNITREQLWNEIKTKGENARKYTDVFVETQFDSLLKAARAMREGIDSVDPTLPGAFCCCGSNPEAAGEIAQILAGKGNKKIIRINNGNYLCGGGRKFSVVFYRAATQMAKLRDYADIFLDEPDTCPQNRYSTSAAALHSHLAGAILEGACGAKHWITRMAAYEPESGKAYREKLSKYSKFYSALEELVPKLTWCGCRIPLSKESYFDLSLPFFGTELEGWSCYVLERLGLPLYFSENSGGAVFMEGEHTHENFTDKEIKDFFSGAFFMASDTAKALVERGFGEYIGVDLREWNGKTMSVEKLYVNGTCCPVQKNALELVPQSDKVKVHSSVCYTLDKQTYTELFPAVTEYQNSLGGTTVTYCGSPNIELGLGAPFSMLNESRKKQFIELLKKTGNLPLYYPGDAEVYLKAAKISDGGMFCSFFNLGIDPLDEITLVSETEISKVEILCADGSRRPVKFRSNGNTVIIEEKAYLLDPVMLFLY
ncbi:MAG: hypothetical protein IKV97_06760 [Clostridia bacterium]|nr:hypothetical protein [Clostridia bacterium]